MSMLYMDSHMQKHAISIRTLVKIYLHSVFIIAFIVIYLNRFQMSHCSREEYKVGCWADLGDSRACAFQPCLKVDAKSSVKKPDLRFHIGISRSRVGVWLSLWVTRGAWTFQVEGGSRPTTAGPVQG